jgi:hypothetical protein
MFPLYHSEGCNTSETVFHWCYVNDLHTTHAVVCWVTAKNANLVHKVASNVHFGHKLANVNSGS